MDIFSDSDSYDRTPDHRSRRREAHRRPGRERARGNGREIDGRTVDISEKISTLANTLQDTSRNLTKVDKMLGQYREHTDDQAEAMALLRENLEESISQLQTQRRSNRVRSSSASTLHTSDLEASSGSEGQRFYPTSPLKDYTSPPGRRRRSQSANVRFKETSLEGDGIHTLHQSMRDLRCDQQRLSDDLDREILRRNRADIDTRRAMESLTEHMTASLRQDSTLGRCQIGASEREEKMAARLLKADREKSKMGQELDRARRLLEQSEDSRESLVQQVEDMRCELQRTREEKTGHERARLETSRPSAQPHGSYADKDGGRDRSDLEKEVAELRVQLCKASVRGEVEELKRALDCKERERVQLSLQLKELSSDLAVREQQQQRMLEQLRDIQSRGQAERRETEALLLESTRSRDELKTRAQEAVRQWRAKCRRLQKELEEARARAQFHTDKASQAAREKENSQAQLKALSQQTEAARRELAEILGRLAQREEELHRKDMELSETHQRQLSLQQEIREVREASATLEDETRRQAAVRARLKEENQRVQEQADTQARRFQRDQDAHAELQAALKQMTAAHAQLAQRSSEEENCRKELQKSTSELQAKLTALQEERTVLSKQLQLEREVHQKELGGLKATMEDSNAKKAREVQDMLQVCCQERDETRAQMRELKADAASDKELCGALRIKLDRMKDECDKLAAQLSTKEEAHALLHRKYQLLKQEVEDKVRSAERRRVSESELVKLEQKVLEMESEQEAVLTSLGEELDAACRSLARNGEDKLQAISQRPELVKDSHRWLAETKTKLRWLCEEVRERDTREQRLRRQHQQTRDQLKALRQSRDSEQRALLQRLDQQEKLMHSLSTEKKELLERSRKKEEEMSSLQDRVLDLELNTRVALDHLESIPEKQLLMENFRDLESVCTDAILRLTTTINLLKVSFPFHPKSCCVRLVLFVVNLVCSLHSRYHFLLFQHEKLDATSRSLKLAALSSTIKGSGTFLSSSLRSDTLSPLKRLTTSDLDDSRVDGAKPLAD
ncbi:centrosomal protein of 128 kDa [Neolamprologus brichardi]|uniref:centrosomal protein of 128 kDa n=1 Tax=Neolamprologus brichardi TaxID=32507 RepID=UPI0016438C4E|nr:centrosomal protein of 128 kDa [Neolamprologus brichardi]